MNQIILLGNVTREVSLQYIQKEDKDVPMVKFDLAVNRQKGDEADFFHCTAFGKQAEFVEKYFGKGKKMLLVGRVANNNYTNKKGEKVYGYQVITEKVYFAGGSFSGENNGKEPPEDFTEIPNGMNLPFNQ